jgi:hypothetical protein
MAQAGGHTEIERSLFVNFGIHRKVQLYYVPQGSPHVALLCITVWSIVIDLQ